MREIAQTGPTGVPSFGFGEAAAAFLGGDAAMYLDTLKIAAMSRDPKQSKVDGKVGYTLHPVGTRCGSETGGFAIASASSSSSPTSSWLLSSMSTSFGGSPIGRNASVP